MKKIFLSLLALVGMAGGLLCTSCSGGSGKDKDGPARAMAGMTVQLWVSTTPALQMQFLQAMEANICNVIYTAGTDNSENGLFSITEHGYDPDTRNLMVSGVVNIESSKILNYTDFKQALGVPSGEEINALNQFIIYFYFTPEGKAVDAAVFVDGTRGSGEGEGTPFDHTFPRGVNFNIVSGHLNLDYLNVDNPVTYPGNSFGKK